MLALILLAGPSLCNYNNVAGYDGIDSSCHFKVLQRNKPCLEHEMMLDVSVEVMR